LFFYYTLDDAITSTFLIAIENVVQACVTEMIDKYNEKHRGRELLTFSEFCEFECVIKDHVSTLQEPAMEMLKQVRGTQ